jgi:hypothetical protein
MMAGYDLVPRAIRSQIASAFNVVVHLERMRDGSRKVVQISEITGMEDDIVSMQDIFRFTRTGIDSNGRVVGGLRLRPRRCGPGSWIAWRVSGWTSQPRLPAFPSPDPARAVVSSRGRPSTEWPLSLRTNDL